MLLYISLLNGTVLKGFSTQIPIITIDNGRALNWVAMSDAYDPEYAVSEIPRRLIDSINYIIGNTNKINVLTTLSTEAKYPYLEVWVARDNNRALYLYWQKPFWDEDGGEFYARTETQSYEQAMFIKEEDFYEFSNINRGQRRKYYLNFDTIDLINIF